VKSLKTKVESFPKANALICETAWSGHKTLHHYNRLYYNSTLEIFKLYYADYTESTLHHSEINILCHSIRTQFIAEKLIFIKIFYKNLSDIQIVA
jgi:hypothetical protein